MKKTLIYIFFIIIRLIYFNTVIYPDSDTSYYLQLQTDILKAVNSFNREALLAVEQDIISQIAEKKYNEFLNYYYLAFAYYQMVFIASVTEKSPKSIMADIDQAVIYLEKSIQLKEDFAEGYILLSSLLGQKAMGEMVSSHFGPKAGYYIKKAKKLEPDNPRCYLVEGVGNYYTPEAFGGGLEVARQSFVKAKELYSKYELKDKRYPDWGHDDLLLWLGKIESLSGNKEMTMHYYEEALSINPESRFIQMRIDEEVKETKSNIFVKWWNNIFKKPSEK